MSGNESTVDYSYKLPQKMNKKRIIKIALIVLVVGSIAAAGTIYYLFNMPHRNVQAADTDYSLKASSIVNEYLENPTLANEKYLDEEGESKIIEISGTVASIDEDFNNNKVVLLKNTEDKAGVSCTFSANTNAHTSNLEIGNSIKVKGVIRAGASFDADLEMYENVIMEKCDIIQ